MEETRTSKYKEYRSSILKEDAPVCSSKDILEGGNETTTLPLDQVIKNENTKEKFDLALFFRKYGTLLKIIAIVVGLLLIILGIILWAKNVWRV